MNIIKIRRMLRKKNVLLFVSLLFIFIYVITSSVSAYMIEEKNKSKYDKYKHYLYKSNNFSS